MLNPFKVFGRRRCPECRSRDLHWDVTQRTCEFLLKCHNCNEIVATKNGLEWADEIFECMSACPEAVKLLENTFLARDKKRKDEGYYSA